MLDQFCEILMWRFWNWNIYTVSCLSLFLKKKIWWISSEFGNFLVTFLNGSTGAFQVEFAFASKSKNIFVDCFCRCLYILEILTAFEIFWLVWDWKMPVWITCWPLNGFVPSMGQMGFTCTNVKKSENHPKLPLSRDKPSPTDVPPPLMCPHWCATLHWCASIDVALPTLMYQPSTDEPCTDVPPSLICQPHWCQSSDVPPCIDVTPCIDESLSTDVSPPLLMCHTDVPPCLGMLSLLLCHSVLCQLSSLPHLCIWNIVDNLLPLCKMCRFCCCILETGIVVEFPCNCGC